MNSMIIIIIIGSAVLIQNMNWCFHPSQESLIRILEAGLLSLTGVIETLALKSQRLVLH